MSDAMVPPHPVVTIQVDPDGTVLVNGQAVEHAGTGDPYAVAVHAAAVRVAQPLGRPVRAIATDSSGRTELIVHPDGRATDFHPVPGSGAVASAQTEPIGTGETSGGLDAMFGDKPAVTPPPAKSARRPWPAGRSLPAVGQRGWLVLGGVVVALLLVLGGLTLMMWPGTEGDPAQPAGVAAEPPAESSESAASDRSREQPEILLVTASALGDGLVKFLVAAPGAGEVEIRVQPARGRPKGQIVNLGLSDIGETLFAGLPAGTATWTVERPNAPVFEGRTTVLDKKADSKPNDEAGPRQRRGTGRGRQ